MQLMNVTSFVIDRTNLFEWFTKSNVLICCLLLSSVIGNGNTQKRQSIGFLLLKAGLEFDLQVVN